MTEKDRGLTWPQIRYWLFSYGMLVGGLLATVWGEALSPIVKELGPGIFTAGLLASVAEPFFRGEFARDAFLAAFRYVLPEELEEEVEKIINSNLLQKSSSGLWKLINSTPTLFLSSLPSKKR